MAKKKDKNAKVHEELEGMNINIDSFGELSSNMNIDKINEFLNKEVEDKKLSNKTDNKSEKK